VVVRLSKTNWQDPLTSEILSTHVAGLQEMVGKIEDALNLRLQYKENLKLTELYINEADRCRIYHAPGFRNWATDPPLVVKVNGEVVTEGFKVDYGGGAVIFDLRLDDTDVVTASFAYVTGEPEAILQALDTYRHEQLQPSEVWVINHNLNCYPSVTVVDSAGTVVIGDVTYNSENQITITFRGAFAGYAYLN